MSKSEQKGFKKAIEILESKLKELKLSLDNEKSEPIKDFRRAQNAGVTLSIYYLSKEIEKHN